MHTDTPQAEGLPPSGISVVIPTHDRAHTLARALDSVRTQTLAPREIIVVDDGSSDATRALIADHYPDVHYLYQPNRGVSAARNAGIDAACGEWIALLDSDDAWLPAKLEVQATLIARNPDHRLCHTEEIWIRNGVRVNPMKKHAKGGGQLFHACLPLCVISPSSVLIHRSLFDEHGLFDESLPACEDYDLWLRLCAREAVLFVQTPQILKYGGHADQLSRQHWGMDRFRVQALEKLLSQETLSDDQRRATAAVLVQKAGVLAKGATKRGRTTDAARYLGIQDRYRPVATGVKSA